VPPASSVPVNRVLDLPFSIVPAAWSVRLKYLVYIPIGAPWTFQHSLIFPSIEDWHNYVTAKAKDARWASARLVKMQWECQEHFLKKQVLLVSYDGHSRIFILPVQEFSPAAIIFSLGPVGNEEPELKRNPGQSANSGLEVGGNTAKKSGVRAWRSMRSIVPDLAISIRQTEINDMISVSEVGNFT
jgi:hypothetical protein